MQRNVLAMSGRAVEAAGDCSTLLLDKTGTITLGNRQATEFLPVPGVDEATLAEAAQLSSLADETPEGRSIVVLAKDRFGLREHELGDAQLVPFTAQTRMSGIDIAGRVVRKGAADAVERWVVEEGGVVPETLEPIVERIARGGGTPLVVAENGRILGVIHLKDIVKEGIAARFEELRRMGIRTVMITGDNPLTAEAIAREAGVDDFLAEATPEDKMAYIKKEQRGGFLVAMTGDGTNDAPVLAQADVGVADEHRDPSRQRGRQHGRPRLESDEAHRGRRDRQAASRHSRFADDVLDRQRRRQVLRDHPRDVRRCVPGAEDLERDEPRQPAHRDPERGHLQRRHHRLAHPARASGREVQGGVRPVLCFAAIS